MRFLILLTTISLTIAQLAVGQDRNLWNNESFGNFDPEKEIIEKRDAFSKHFINSDGHISAFISTFPIHYLQGNEWKTVFHSIVPKANGFENVHNNYKTFYPATSEGSVVTVFENGMTLKDMLEMRMYYEVNGQKVQVQNIQSKSGNANFNELTYSDVYGGGIDLRLTQNTTQRKMDYLIESFSALGTIPNGAQHLVFEEQIELPQSWTAELRENIIYLKDASGAIKAFYESPEYYEAPTQKSESNDESRSEQKSKKRIEKGSYSLIQNGNFLIIKTLVSVEWLTTQGRLFPIVIDPTLNVTTDNTAWWTGNVQSDDNGSWTCNTTNSSNLISFTPNFPVGLYDDGWYYYIYSPWAKFNTSSIPDCSTINSLTLNSNVYYDFSSRTGLNLRRVANDPVVSSNATRLNDIRTGSLYNTIAYNATGNFSSTGWKVHVLGGTANADFQSSLSSDWFAIGYHLYQYNWCDDYVAMRGYDHANRPYIVVDYTVTSLTAPQALANVTVGATLGGLLPNASMTSSTCWNGDGSGNCASGAGHEGWRGRVFNADPAGALAWAAQNNVIGTDYLQIDLGSVVPINAIATQSRGITRTSGANDCCNDQRVTNYQVQVSNDGVSYTVVGTYSGNAALSQAVVTNNMPTGLTARFVRLYPTSIVSHMSLRAEIISIPCFNTGAQSVTLSGEIVPNANTVRWWSAATGGTLLGTGQNFTVSISANTTYYAEAYNTVTGCASSTRTAVTAQVRNLPAAVNAAIAPATLATNDYLWHGNASNVWNAANFYRYDGTNFVQATAATANTTNVYVLDETTANICGVTPIVPICNATHNSRKVHIGAGAQLNQNVASTLNVTGNWVNNGTFNQTAGTVSFNGAPVATISGTTSPETFYHVTMNKTGAGTVTLNKPITISNTLQFNSGNLFTTSTNLLTIGTSVTNAGTLNYTPYTPATNCSVGASSIVGPIRRYIANGSTANYIFPVGNTTRNRYAEIQYTAAPATGGTITAEYIAGVCPIGYNGLPATINGQFIDNYENEGYWSITPAGGNLNTSAYTLRLRGNNLSTVNSLTPLRIIKSVGHTAWNDNVAGDGNHVGTSGCNTTADFLIENTGMVGFSFFNIGSSAVNPLPVELTAFIAECTEEATAVDVQWTTTSEHNSSHFIVERSFDGANWDEVGTVQAAGNSNALLHYELLDNATEVRSHNVIYYRLNQFDTDGQSKVYGPASAECLQDILGMELFPNPSSTLVNVLLHGEYENSAYVTFTDIQGKEVRRIQYNEQAGKLYTVDINDLEPGIYVVRLMDGQTNKQFVRFVKQ